MLLGAFAREGMYIGTHKYNALLSTSNSLLSNHIDSVYVQSETNIGYCSKIPEFHQTMFSFIHTIFGILSGIFACVFITGKDELLL